MSKGKKLALFGGILLVLIAAVVVIAILQSQGIMPTGEESSEESSVGTETEYLLQYDETEIETIEVQNAAASYTLVSQLTETEDSSGNAETEQTWTLQGYEDWELTSSSIENLTSVGSSLRAVSTVAASTGSVDLANFGLDDPYAEVTIHYTDGTEVTVYVGNETPDGVYRYAMLSDRDGVFTVYKSVATYAGYDLTNLRSITIEQINVEEELTYLLLEQKDSRPIEISMWEDGETHEGIYDTSAFKMLQPYDWYAAVVSGNVGDMFAEYTSVSVEKLVESEAEDLDQYGLGEESFEHHVKLTTRVEVESDTEESSSEDSSAEEAEPVYEYHTVDYYFGTSAGTNEDGEELIYFREGDSNDVYTVVASSLDCFDFEPFDYLQKLVFIYNIQELDGFKVTGTAEGQSYEGRILRQDESEVSSTEESSAERLEVYYLNDQLVDGSAFRTQYQKVIGVMMDYEITPEEGTPDYDENDKITMEYYFSDGTTHTVEFYRLNEFYYVTPWGDSWMACNASQIDLMWEGFANLEASE